VRRNSWFLALQLVFAAAVLWFAARTIDAQWEQARAAGFGFAPRWSFVLLSALIVLLTYALLIETWRYLVRSWGSNLSRADAARIWFVSNLGRYVPGKVWQIGAMGVMAQRRGVSAVAATGSSLVINLVNLVGGVLVITAFGARALLQSDILGGATGVTIIAASAVLLGGAMVLLPRWLPLLLRLVGRVTGRALEAPPLSSGAIWTVLAACVAAWVLYGIAFFYFAKGVTPAATGPVSGYIVAFTASYLVGYVILVAPGGLVFRETALVRLLADLSLATGGAGLLIAVASRLWLTVTEVVPGVLYLLAGVRLPGAPTSSKSLGNASND
jgi:glycosyltransferase 2 family protein